MFCIEMEYNNTSNNSCTLFNAEQAKRLAMIRGYTALCVAVVLLCLVTAIFILREFRIHFAQIDDLRQKSCPLAKEERLLVYVTLAAILPSFGFILHGFEHKYASEYGNTSELCMVSAFLVQTFGWSELLILSGVVVYLFCTVYKFKPVNGETTRLIPAEVDHVEPRSSGHCTRKECIWEFVFLFFAIIFPFTFNWVPFLYGDYGEAGPWCWITSVQFDCTKSKTGFIEQLGLWYIPFIAISSVIFVLIFITCCVANNNRRWNKSRRIGFLLFYFFFALMLEVFEIPVRIRAYETTKEIYTLWLIYAICTPLSKLLGPLAFAVYLGYFLPLRKMQSYGIDPIHEQNIN